MVFPTPHEEARREGYSDASHERRKRKDLVYSRRRWLQPAGENRLTWSEYSSTFWTNDGNSTDAGLISIGPYADENLVSWSGSYDNSGYGYQTVGNYRGVQTWQYASATTLTSSAISDSGFAYPLCFSIRVDTNHVSAGESYALTLTVTNGAGTQTLGTASYTGLSGESYVWVSAPTASNDAQVSVNFTITYSGSEDFYWFFTGAQLEARGVSTPGTIIRTRGGARVYTVDTVGKGIAKIFPDEQEWNPEPWEGRAIPREGRDRSSFVIPHSAYGRTL